MCVCHYLLLVSYLVVILAIVITFFFDCFVLCKISRVARFLLTTTASLLSIFADVLFAVFSFCRQCCFYCHCCCYFYRNCALTNSTKDQPGKKNMLFRKLSSRSQNLKKVCCSVAPWILKRLSACEPKAFDVERLVQLCLYATPADVGPPNHAAWHGRSSCRRASTCKARGYLQGLQQRTQAHSALDIGWCARLGDLFGGSCCDMCLLASSPE